MSDPVVSIIMPVYNAENHLVESIESILNQTFHDFELIILNDGSTDNSESIITSFLDVRIHTENRKHGFIASLNAGLEKARGKYIARMDADDIMLPDRLSVQVAFMEKHPEIAVCGSFAEYFGNLNRIVNVEKKHFNILLTMFTSNPLINPTTIIRRSALGMNRYVNSYPYAEDYKLWTDLVLQGQKFANIPQVLLRYRVSSSQVSSACRSQMDQSSKMIQLEFAEMIMDKVLDQNPDYLDRYNYLVKLTNEGYISYKIFLNKVRNLYIALKSENSNWQ